MTASSDEKAPQSESRPLRTFLDNLTGRELIERLQLALEGSGLGIWDWDPRDNSVQFDRRWCEMLGLDHESISMELSTWESRVHPDDLADCYADIQAHIEGKVDRYENVHRMRHADGHWVYILDQGRIAEREPSGRPSRFTGTHLDVTATERAKRVLEDQHRVLREFVLQVPAAVAMLDRSLGYVAASRRWRAAFDLGDGQLAGELALPGPLLERCREIGARALGGEHVIVDEDPVTMDGGVSTWWRWEAHPWHDEAGSVAGVLLAVEELTEAVLRRATEAQERRLAALGKMANGIAHEINTPLQVLELESRAIADELASPTPDETELGQSAEAIQATVERLSEVVKAMRALTEDPGQRPPGPVAVGDIVASVNALVGNRFRTRDVAFSIELDVPEDAMVVAHASDVGRILLNLSSNAYDAVVGVDAASVTLEVAREGEQVVFRCIDNGSGIAQEHLDQVMQPFFTTKPVGDGTGLGLSLSRALARRNRGTLVVVPRDRGALFELRLPMEEAS